MKVEILIYAYLAICVAMIIFNIVCIFIFRRKDKNLHRRSVDFTRAIEIQMEQDCVEEEHRLYLSKKLKHVRHMMAFDETLEKLYGQTPEKVRTYVSELTGVFAELTYTYGRKNKVQAAYYPYIIKKYQVFKGIKNQQVTEQLLELIKQPGLYCRENALQALYSMGDAYTVVEALKIVNRKQYFHHEKMIADGLLSFEGNVKELDALLWEEMGQMNLRMQRSILDYFRFSSGTHYKKMFDIMQNEDVNQELRFSAIRYFAKYHYEPAFPTLKNFVTSNNPIWEYKAIAASALGNYPSEETEELLKGLLSDRNWHVRYNASDSLERLGIPYYEMSDVFEGKDRYASEMLRYRFDRKKLKKKEETVI